MGGEQKAIKHKIKPLSLPIYVVSIDHYPGRGSGMLYITYY